MEKRTEDNALRPLAQLAGAMLVWVVTGVISGWTLRSGPPSALVRGAMVALGVGGFATWLVAVGRLIMTQDEFSRQIHLVAIALACGAIAVLLVAGDLLQTAGFLGDVSLQSIWMLMGVLWWLGIVIASRYYR
jgi:hypothetical protein